MKLKQARRGWVIAATGVVASALILWGLLQALMTFWPLQSNEWKNRWTLWRAGVTEIESAGLRGYQRDNCLKAKACSCVALVHGLGDDSMTWRNILAWPAQGWLGPVKLVAFDLPGSGRSDPPARMDEYRVRKQAEKLRAALEPICPSWIVVGNSLGGWISSWMALDWPKGVHRLILSGSAGLETSSEVRRIFSEPTLESMKEFQRRAYFKGRPLPDTVWRAVVERMKSSNSRAVMEAQTEEDGLRGRLPSLHLPTLLLWGAADQVSPEAVGRQFNSLIPGSIWRALPECGHLPQKECPLEVIRAIGNMLDYGGV
jgi:pimeloyl-ACP methyl ester carboxylesterase